MQASLYRQSHFIAKAFSSFCLILLCSILTTDIARASTIDNGAVIYAYHRISEPEYPSTNINFEQFESHIRKIMQDGYNVASLDEIYTAFVEKKQLPPKTIAITFEGGHHSILKEAIPLLKKYDLPFTVFFSVDQADWSSKSYLSWKELKSLKRYEHATLGLHPATYRQMLDSEQETTSQINRARARYRDEFDEEASYFSYPFGEYSLEIKEQVKKNHFKAAFGQQSGVAHDMDDLFALPRFAMTEGYGGVERFELTANALPLKVKDISPNNPLLAKNPPAIGFTLGESYKNLDQLSCFATAAGKTNLEIIGNRIEIRLDHPFTRGRGRINCTLPASFDEEGTLRWRWFGMLFSIKETLLYQ